MTTSNQSTSSARCPSAPWVEFPSPSPRYPASTVPGWHLSPTPNFRASFFLQRLQGQCTSMVHRSYGGFLKIDGYVIYVMEI